MTRFTATVKWNDEWFSNLKPIEKLVFIYLTDRCDNAGFFEINKRVDSFLIGITEDEFISNLKAIRKSYLASKDGRKVWLKNYIKYQKNTPLNPDNNAHKQIIEIIKSNKDNFEYDFNKLGAKEGLISPLCNVIVKVKVEEGVNPEFKDEHLWTEISKRFFNDYNWKEKFCRDKNLDPKIFDVKAKEFIKDIELKEDFKELKELKNHFTNWYNLKNKNGQAFMEKEIHTSIKKENQVDFDKYKKKPHNV